MAGIYIHIPFCASRCIYCDFYSTTLRGKAHEYVDAVLKEYQQRSDFLPKGEPLRTVYIGGGTPSQLPAEELARLIDGIISFSSNISIEEITIEANPEDITEYWAETIMDRITLSSSNIHTLTPSHLRISMGVQSLIDSELRLLNRRHDSQKPSEAVKILQSKGFSNISLDLMYGLPNQTMKSWEKSIDGIVSLDPQHISAYCLSIEEGTRLEKMINDGVLATCDDDTCLEMEHLLRGKLKKAGYVQYEISNYAKPGFESKHNSSYWDGTPYLGLGPGAHSYDGASRRCWNEHDVTAYIDGERKEGYELLTETDRYNEMIMLSLRTAKGIDCERLMNNTPENKLLNKQNIIKQLRKRNLVTIKQNHLILTEAGLALADEVIRDLMI